MLLLLLCLVGLTVSSEEYSVSSIWCSYSTSTSSYSLSAVLTKPLGYTAEPVLADRSQESGESEGCSISHLAGLDYKLEISDLASCGVLVRNGFLSVRVWFPQIPGVFTSEDQEVIILCKPPERASPPLEQPVQSVAVGEIVTEEAEEAEEVDKIQYAVSLYRETSDSELGLTAGEGVPIGTLLQLRVSVKPTSPAWRYLWLQELVLSPSGSDPRAPGHVTLVQGGCRTQEFMGVVPAPPVVSPNNSREVRLDFEAVMLDINRSQESKVWLHVTTRACTSQQRCSALCDRQAARPRVVRSIETEASLGLGSLRAVRRQNDREANFTDNIGLSITRPGEGYYSPSPTSLPASQQTNCTTFLIFGILMGCLLIVASVMMCLLAYRLNSLAAVYKVQSSHHDKK